MMSAFTNNLCALPYACLQLELVADEEQLKKRQEKFGATKILFKPPDPCSSHMMIACTNKACASLYTYLPCCCLQLELVADEEKLKKRQEKFGATKILFNPGAKDLKDPELMKKRAEKFKGAGAGKSMGTVESKDDDTRKKV
jgi:hypothetical protein